VSLNGALGQAGVPLLGVGRPVAVDRLEFGPVRLHLDPPPAGPPSGSCSASSASCWLASSIPLGLAAGLLAPGPRTVEADDPV